MNAHLTALVLDKYQANMLMAAIALEMQNVPIKTVLQTKVEIKCALLHAHH